VEPERAAPVVIPWAGTVQIEGRPPPLKVVAALIAYLDVKLQSRVHVERQGVNYYAVKWAQASLGAARVLVFDEDFLSEHTPESIRKFLDERWDEIAGHLERVRGAQVDAAGRIVPAIHTVAPNTSVACPLTPPRLAP
jgi:hypothetical protein